MFLSNCKNILVIILYSEVVWVILYCYVATSGVINDDLVLLSTTFLLLALAGLEFCVGFIISICFRTFKKSFDLFFKEESKQNNHNNLNKYT